MSLVLPIVEPNSTEDVSARMVAIAFSVPSTVGAQYAELVAEFVSWTPLPMDRRPDGSHTITVWLETGRSWRYQFHIDDERWINDWNASDVEGRAGDLAVIHT